MRPVSLAWWWVAPVASSAGFALLAPVVARCARPRIATWALSVGSLLLAAASVALPSLLLVALLGQWDPVAAMGHWSVHLLHTLVLVPRPVLVGAAVLVVGQGLLLTRASWRQGRALFEAWRLARRSPGSLVVLPDERPTVFALPGWPGRIVAARGLLRFLTPLEVRVVLAHEQAHLDGRHELHRAAVSLASAVNPILWPARGAVRLATERWADERAAAEVGDRRVVARTIGRVARACSDEALAIPATMGAAGPGAALRVESLLRPAAGRRAHLVIGLAVLALAPAGAAIHVARQTNAVFQQAEHAYGASAPSVVIVAGGEHS